ncbi:MAG: hypothetical protein KDE27_09955 [Planctomycetes bacterium]|nr:hypothetical protein [Planctomycetota bacterium]
MNTRLSTLAGVAALCCGLAAQVCHFHPSDTPAVGTPDPRPFGSGVPTDPVYGSMRYQMQIPTAVLGNQPLDIVEIFAAPAGTQTRSYTEIKLRLGHNPNPLTSAMGLNMVGFTDSPLAHNYVSFATTADQWLPLGMAHPFHYDPANGMLVVEFFVRDAAATGSGSTGFRTDPAIPFVWRTGSSYNNGILEAGGGIKLRFCTDAHGTTEYLEGGCPGSNSLHPQLSYGGSPQLGSTLDIHVTNGPGAAGSLAVLVFSFRPRIGPFALDGFGGTGCTTYVFSDVVSWLVTSGGSHTVSLPLATGLQPGFPLWNQWFFFDPGANPLGLSGSNFGRFMIGN